MAGTLKIMSWNANGLLNHQQELQVILDIKKIDVCLISETHFTKQSFIKFKGYKVYHSIHPENTARGGSAVIVKANIYHNEEIKIEANDIQATVVSVRTKNYNINVVGLYSPPKYNIKAERYLELFRISGNRFIIGGDFNAKHTFWGSRLITTKGKELLKAMNDYKCEPISTGKPTYWPTDPAKIPDLIDFFIVKNISSNYIHIKDSVELNSDHTPIVLILSECVFQKPCNPVLVNKYTDWKSFKISLAERIDLIVPLQTDEQLDSEVEKFMNDIQKSAWENTPEIKKRIKSNFYPRDIMELIKEKRKARRKWYQTRAPKDKTRLNNLTSQLKEEIRQLKNDVISESLRELTNDRSTEYSLWKITRNLKRPTMQIPPIRSMDGSWARNNQQKATQFSEYLENIFQPNPAEDSEGRLDAIGLDSLDIPLVTLKEIKLEIKMSTGLRKAPGFDLITGRILREIPRQALVKLTNLINASFRLKYVPQMWKVAEVVMIPKPGKPPHEITSYRPISLLPSMSKLFERLLLKRLKPIIENKKLIPDHQFGFRNKHSTIDQVHRITNVIEQALEEKKVCSAIFLDVSQAFDKVWHEGLNYKLKLLLPAQYAKILKSYITERFFRIKQEDAYSDLKKIQAGVPQGSVLGPILYLLYTSDLPSFEQNIVATFADDTAILSVSDNNIESSKKLQIAIADIQSWTKKWRIKLNEGKSVHVDFTNKRIEHRPVFINNQVVPYENTAKYLGMTLDAKLRWKPHVKRKQQELKLKYRKMYWLLGRCSSLSVYNKLLLYRQVLKPVWTYGIQLWGCASQSNKNIIQRFQNKVLRGIVDSPWYIRNDNLHKDLGIPTVESEIRKFAKSHERRLQQHINVEALQLLNSDGLVRRLKRVKPFELCNR